jgi:hypothetical protein
MQASLSTFFNVASLHLDARIRIRISDRMRIKVMRVRNIGRNVANRQRQVYYCKQTHEVALQLFQRSSLKANCKNHRNNYSISSCRSRERLLTMVSSF